jgi:hypothetical protein
VVSGLLEIIILEIITSIIMHAIWSLKLHRARDAWYHVRDGHFFGFFLRVLVHSDTFKRGFYELSQGL